METGRSVLAAGRERERAGGNRGKRIVLATFGSLGDLHPALALALGLKARGHRPLIATSEIYRRNVEAEGLEFFPVRPDGKKWKDDPDIGRKIMDTRNGTEFLLRELIFPNLRDSYADLKEALRDADMLISHPITFAGPILAEQIGLRWASTVLSPISMMSAYDFPVLAPAPELSALRRLGPLVTRPLLRVGERRTLPWVEPIRQFRAELGLPPGRNPILAGQHAPELVLALFSKVLGKPQPDWPRNTTQTGFLFYDRREGETMPPELAKFLASGPAPLVFTLGTAAVMDARDFYHISAAAAKRINRRAVLLTGSDRRNVPEQLPQNVVAFDYAPYSEIFPKAAAIIHSGGIGTTAQALRAGKPMLIMPFANDQPDNADRIQRLGVGRVVPRHRYNILHTAAEIQRLIAESLYPSRAAEVGKIVQEEEGLRVACDAIEARLNAH